MKDRSRYWHRGRTSYQLWSRTHLPSLRSLAAAVAFCFRYGNDWSIRKWNRGGPIRAELRTIPRFQYRCYCPDGTTTELRLSFFNAFIWIQFSRSHVKTPCWCDVVVWKMFPDGNEDDVEEAGGWDVLNAMHPGLDKVSA